MAKTKKKTELDNQHLADRQAGLIDETGKKIQPFEQKSVETETEENDPTRYEGGETNSFLEARIKGLVDEQGNPMQKEETQEEAIARADKIMKEAGLK